MLEYIKGPLTQIGDSYLVVEVGGVGMKVIATQNTTGKFKRETPETISLHTHLHISENKWEVFGFADKVEREAFLLLLDCRGVGTKAAINILNSFSPARLRRIALGQEPVTVLQQAQGIGAKSADRILVELKEKLPEMANWVDGSEKKKKDFTQYSPDDLYRALKNLGYRASEIQTAISQSPDLPPTLSEAVKELLRSIGKS